MIDISVIDATFRDVRVVTLVVKVKTRIELRIGGWWFGHHHVSLNQRMLFDCQYARYLMSHATY